jgi:hypothetical protein
MGIRPQIWAITGLCLALLALFVVWQTREPQRVPTSAVGSQEPRDESSAAAGVAASRRSGGPNAASSRAADEGSGVSRVAAPAAGGKESTQAFSRTAAETRGRWSRRPEDRAIEADRGGARSGEAGGLASRSTAGSQPAGAEGSETPPDEQLSEVALEPIITYLLNERLSEEFPGNEYVPFGYPVSKVRLAVVQEVAGLSPAELARLWEEANRSQGGPQKPIMSNRGSRVLYDGPDWEEPDPAIVDIDPDRQSPTK